MPRKTGQQINREVEAFLRTSPRVGSELYWPGGDGGGGKKRARSGGVVVKPHRKTSPKCVKCGQYHTLSEHRRHGDPPAQPATRPSPSRKKASKTKASPTRTKARPGAERAPISGERRTPERDLPAIVQREISRVGGEGRFGEEKVFISSLWRHLVSLGQVRGWSLDEFKRWLVTANRGQVVGLARADMPGLMDPRHVEESEIRDRGSRFHFVVDREVRRAESSRRSERVEQTRPGDDDQVDLLLEAVTSVPPEGRFGKRKVFIADAWAAATERGIEMSLADFKRWLVRLLPQGRVLLARADLVDAMDRARVAESEIRSLGSTFHFILDNSRQSSDLY